LVKIKEVILHNIKLNKMARADLLIKLIKAGTTNDKELFKKVAESIIAEERIKKHSILADELEKELHNNAPVLANKTIFNPVNGNSSNLSIENFVQNYSPVRNINDLVLSQPTQKILQEFVQEHHRGDILRSYNLEPRNRLLLVGAPGNGKTSLAEAIATSLIVPFYTIRYDGIIGSFLGETANRLRKLIDFIKTQHCVLFFDEFDSIGKERGDIHETGEIKRVVSSLLMQLDSLPSYVIVIAATNHPELLDKAVWRRFQIRLELPNPSSSMVVEWLSKFENKCGINFPVSKSILAKQLAGLNFSEIEEFGLNVFRKHVLSLPDSDMKGITSSCLKELALKYKLKALTKKK